ARCLPESHLVPDPAVSYASLKRKRRRTLRLRLRLGQHVSRKRISKSHSSPLADGAATLVKHHAPAAVQGPVGHDAPDGMLVAVLGGAVRLALALVDTREPIAHVDLIHCPDIAFLAPDRLAVGRLRALDVV